jgi:hypothetical protein
MMFIILRLHGEPEVAREEKVLLPTRTDDAVNELSTG